MLEVFYWLSSSADCYVPEISFTLQRPRGDKVTINIPAQRRNLGILEIVFHTQGHSDYEKLWYIPLRSHISEPVFQYGWHIWVPVTKKSQIRRASGGWWEVKEPDCLVLHCHHMSRACLLPTSSNCESPDPRDLGLACHFVDTTLSRHSENKAWAHDVYKWVLESAACMWISVPALTRHVTKSPVFFSPTVL